ncbi:unnamed protein product [Adineta steineri]|uniref:Uncharacterized protein n=2 Tax=Adineta steineri TaxID=433720 RepID=A0A820C4S3_9BILA|nr:unnamed protein product [Adineta steineri]CAF4210549.1 unnamed protein product [Adineta steineri]
MKDQCIAAINQINGWRDQTIQQINQHVDVQIRILETDFEQLQHNLHEKCEENLDTTRAYCSAQNIELFNELENACRLLEFHMIQLETVTSTMSTYRVVTIKEQMERKQKEKSDASELKTNKSEEISIVENINTTLDNGRENKDLSVQLVSSISDEIDSNPAMMKSSNNDSGSINNKSISTALRIHDNDLINKCPMCFMIFPMCMTESDRSQHINEHCTDS